MQLLKTKQELKVFVNRVKQDGKTIGFVPTMGALHKGHLSLVECSLNSTDITISSIFVNPTQFNNINDLKSYPRDEGSDIAMLEKIGCHAVFMPSDTEMYPEKDSRIFDFEGIDLVMEGEHRPGHFNGVAQIVSKLFDAVSPHKAFFGQKDFQQVAIIRQMTKSSKYNIEIVACPTVRESDGLAMSSRNLLLSQEHRRVAPVIHRTVQDTLKTIKIGDDVVEIKKQIKEEIEKSPLLKLEYFEVVDEFVLKPQNTIDKDGHLVACIAVWAGSVRLIDNIIFNC